MADLIRRSEAQELLACFTEKNNLGHTPHQIVSNLPSADPKWISTKERLPEIGVPVLTYSKYGHVSDRTLKQYFNGKVYFTPDGLTPGSDIPYWMPLPEPPKEGGGEG